jgi:hypothetical protein
VEPVSARPPAKAKTNLNFAPVGLEESARHAHEGGLHRQAGALERLARDGTEVLGKLQAAHGTNQEAAP